MIKMTPARILITAPMKKNDATEYTYVWGTKAIKMARSFGYQVHTLEKEKVTRSNVENEIEQFKPRLVLHVGHGCARSLQSNTECILNIDYNIDEIMKMAYSQDKIQRQKAYDLLSLGLDIDPCQLSCQYPTNIDKVEGSLVVAIACNSSAVLGRDAIDYGVQAYAGEKDLMMFPVDSLRTQEVFGDMELVFIKELLMGYTYDYANKVKMESMDNFIRKNKKIKYMALPMLWNKLNWEILGNKNAEINQ